MHLSLPYQGGQSQPVAAGSMRPDGQGRQRLAVLKPETWVPGELSQCELSPVRGQGNGPRGARVVLRVNQSPETGMLCSGSLDKPVQGRGHS